VSSDSTDRFYKSVNGLEWLPVEQAIPANVWRGIAGGNGKVVISAQTGTDQKIAVSA
jgi:hypothetical protein